MTESPFDHSVQQNEFYHENTRKVARVIFELLHPTSVLDVGCGLGAFVRSFQELGCQDALGLDGDFIDQDKLLISPDSFRTQNLNDPWDLGRKFDLVMSLEVAEHLSPDSADQFVKSLVNHSDIVIFSAAIPGQLGDNHLNEQWMSYWRQKFKNENYLCFDLLRPRLTDITLPFWYRYNTQVFVSADHARDRGWENLANSWDWYEHVAKGGMGLKRTSLAWLAAARQSLINRWMRHR